MAQVTIPNLDEAVVEELARRAGAHGHSLEEEVRAILTDVARQPLVNLRREAAAMRRRLAGRPQTDSVQLIREDRER